MYNKIKGISILVVSLISIMGCNGDQMNQDKIKYKTIEEIPVEKWEKLSQKKIYFGHQSLV